LRGELNQSRPALYYPYIHIRSEQWLKATLLCVPTVKRIVPEDYLPEDQPTIRPYTSIVGPNGPLLQAVPAYTPAANDAQQLLRYKLAEHAAEINERFNRSRAPVPDKYWIHEAKFADALLDYLEEHNLAWHSEHPQAFGKREWYALHPILGKAIMTTLGLSIAREQYYDIVTADGRYHEALLASREDMVFEKLLGKGGRKSTATRAQVQQSLAHLVITLTGVNYKAFRPQSIPELQASKRFQGFQRILRESASTIDRQGAPEQYKRELKEEADKIISSWHDIKHDLSSDLREVLFESVAIGTEILGKHSGSDEVIKLGIVAGIGVWRVAAKISRWKQNRESPLQYLSEIVSAQDPFLQLKFPLGLETDIHDGEDNGSPPV
jgi:hypothetical protein